MSKGLGLGGVTTGWGGDRVGWTGSVAPRPPYTNTPAHVFARGRVANVWGGRGAGQRPGV